MKEIDHFEGCLEYVLGRFGVVSGGFACLNGPLHTFVVLLFFKLNSTNHSTFVLFFIIIIIIMIQVPV